MLYISAQQFYLIQAKAEEEASMTCGCKHGVYDLSMPYTNLSKDSKGSHLSIQAVVALDGKVTPFRVFLTDTDGNETDAEIVGVDVAALMQEVVEYLEPKKEATSA